MGLAHFHTYGPIHRPPSKVQYGCLDFFGSSPKHWSQILCVCFSIIFLETNHRVAVANYQSESVDYHRMTQLLALKVGLVQISEQVAAFTFPYSPNPFGCRESIGNRKKKKRFMRSIWLFGCYSCWLCLKNDAYFWPLLPPVFNEHR